MDRLPLCIDRDLLQIVDQIRFHTIDDFKIRITAYCVIRLGKCLHCSMIRDCQCRMPPLHRPL